MAASGRGWLVDTTRVTATDLRPRPDVYGSPTAEILADYVWGGLSAPAPAEIPYAWIAQPVRFRTDSPINSATITRSGSGESTADDLADQVEHLVWSAEATLDTVSDQDPANLAAYLVTYYAQPRMRCPQLRFSLLRRWLEDHSGSQCRLLLGIKIGDRISITGAPTTWPDGASELIVEGIHHTIDVAERWVEFNTSPVIGTTPGVPGPWFRLGGSVLGGTDLLAY